ncbi:MAG TPA: hypothetical protein VFZ53_14470, partial [Polyangiaceae bacterium]
MSIWTGATEGLTRFLATRELDRQRALAEQIAEQDRQYQRSLDEKAETRAGEQLKIQQAAEKRLEEIQKQAQIDAERQRRFQRASTLRTTAQPGEISPEDVANLSEFGLDQGIIKRHAGMAIPVGLPSQQASPDAIPTLPTSRALPIVPERFESLGGVEYQEQQRGEQARKDLAAQNQAALDARAEADRKSREDMANDRNAMLLAIRSMTAGGKPLSPYQKVQVANALRDDFTRETQNFQILGRSFRELQSTLSQGNAAGDRAAIFQFMRALDPLSVVRESEQLQAEHSRSIPEGVRAVWNRVVTGERLTPEQRAQFLQTVNSIYSASAVNHQKRVSEYVADAEDAGIDPRRVIRDYSEGPPQTPTAPPAGRGADPAAEARRKK